MASNGYKDYAVNSDIILRFNWIAGDYNIANNYTPINWYLSIRNTSSRNKISSEVNKVCLIRVDGATVFNDEVNINCNPGIAKTLISGVRNIPHNINGTKTFTFEVNQYFGPVYYPSEQTIVDLGTKTFEGSGVLDAIPRPSVLGNISNFTIGNSITVPVTKYSDVSDTLNIYIGDTRIKMVQGLINNQSIAFTNAELDTIYNAMPNVTNATFRFVNTTYSGSTIIGTSTKTAIGSINANVKPTISVSLVEAVSGLAAKFGTFVQSRSKINGTINATAGTGSSIESYNIKLNGATYTSSSFTTEFLINSGTGSSENKDNQCVVTVTDRRGRTATSTTNITVAEYTSPTISNIVLARCNQNGTLNDNGTYCKVNGNATITSISNRNNKTFKLEYKLRTASTWTTNQTYTTSYTYNVVDKIVGPISADDEYDFRITAQDYFVTNTNQVPLSSGFTVLDINASGKGLAIGKVSNRNAFQIGMGIYDRFDTNILNGLSLYGGGSNPIDADTTIEELILTTLNTPDTRFWYVRTMFYSTKSATSNRTQIAYPYNQQMPIYYRYYINGTGWSAWRAGDIKEISINSDYGYIWYSSGELRQYGKAIITPLANNQVTQATITFIKPFDTIMYANCKNVSGWPNAITDNVRNYSTTTLTLNITRTTTVATAVFWEAIGYKDPL